MTDVVVFAQAGLALLTLGAAIGGIVVTLGESDVERQ